MIPEEFAGEMPDLTNAHELLFFYSKVLVYLAEQNGGHLDIPIAEALSDKPRGGFIVTLQDMETLRLLHRDVEEVEALIREFTKPGTTH